MRLAATLTLSASAEDVVQEASARVYQRFAALENPAAYLRVTVVNVARETHRRHGRERRRMITGLTWATNGRRLLVTSIGPAQIIQVLDTTRRQSAANPTTVEGHDAYDSPIMLNNGTIMGLLDTCPNGDSCPAPDPTLPSSTTINIIQSPSGHVLSSFDTADIGQLIIDPSGHNIEATVVGSSHPGPSATLYRLIDTVSSSPAPSQPRTLPSPGYPTRPQLEQPDTGVLAHQRPSWIWYV